MTKNKKAEGWIMIFIFGFCIFLTFLFYNSNMKGNEMTTECEDYELILKSINGMKDQDSGFFSGGTIKQKNLLFDDGLLLTFDDYDLEGVDLYIGGKYYIEKCNEVNSVSKYLDRTKVKINLIKEAKE